MSYSTIHQHEPLRAPASWGENEKRLIAQLEEILDDLYSRFNRIKTSDLGQDLQTTIKGLKLTITGIGDDVSEIAQTINHLSSQIEQNEQDIETKVSGTEIASVLNRTAQSVLIDPGKINLQGYATIIGLSESGGISIDGGRIQTGQIDAARIDTDNLQVKHLIHADGSFAGLLMCANDPDYTISIGLVDDGTEPSFYPSGDTAGNVGALYHPFSYIYANHFVDPSSLRFKKDVLDVTDEDYDIMSLRPVTYALKKDATGSRSLGFIAEEVYESCPMLVSLDAKGQPSALEYNRLTVIAIREIQRLRRKVDELESRISKLGGGST